MKKSALSLYHKKRDFKKTPEPKGKIERRKGAKYLIQKHAASHLHYDFRLELDGTLKSWAVTKGPSLDPSVKRLAVEVEDHPVSYGDFEGIIPQGQYGGGTVMLWDHGTWQVEGDAESSLKKGHLNFELFGERLKGKWSLVRMKNFKENNGKNNWLLIKKDDEFAKAGDNDKLLKKEITSVTTGREMKEIAQQKKKVWNSKKSKAINKLPAFFNPQLATLSDETPQGVNWIHEIKFDGYRTLAFIENGETKMMTRNGLDWSQKYQSIILELKKLNVQNAIFDGEVVALDEKQRSNFLTLQEKLKAGNDTELQYYVFDLLYLNGEDLRHLPLIQRKEKLAEIFAKTKFKNIFYSEHFAYKGDEFLQKLCDLNYEGLISKQAQKSYFSGRNKDWLKSKCHKRQEFLIAGYTSQKTALSSLLLGVYKGDKLQYCGKVGTGFTNKIARDILAKLKKLRIDSSPFEKIPAEVKRGAIFVKPQLICEVEFSEWTSDNALRHPAFKGLRLDKKPLEIHKENALILTKSKNENEEVSGIKITHPNRIIYPKHDLTKMDLVNYYHKISAKILPFIQDRLISVVRCPEGLNSECFFQRHENIESEFIHQLKFNKNHPPYIYVKDEKGLLTLIQFGVIEIHAWSSRIDDVMKPDRLIFDLDPDEKISWENVCNAAADVKLRFDKLGFQSFLRTTGGKGLHVVVPIKRQHEWKVVKAFAKAFAQQMESENHELYITNMNKEKRRGKIFIDYLRNDTTATAITSYAARARENATVATPLFWEELDYKLDPKKFTITTIFDHLKKQKTDPWKDINKTRQTLTASLFKDFKIKA